jgi:hypothetical protein
MTKSSCVISAQAELVLEAVAGPDSTRDDLRRIVRASAQATLLASQLLSQACESTTEPAALALDASIEAACGRPMARTTFQGLGELLDVTDSRVQSNRRWLRCRRMHCRPSRRHPARCFRPNGNARAPA